MHNRLVLDVDWLDEMKIEGCQRESLTQSTGMWTMSFADQRDTVYCKPDVGTQWKFVISLESQLVEELHYKREVQV